MTTEVPTVAEIDCATNTITYRPMTDDEIAAQQVLHAEFETRQKELEARLEAEAEAKASALAKLEALGLTEEEAKAIVG